MKLEAKAIRGGRSVSQVAPELRLPGIGYLSPSQNAAEFAAAA